MAVSITHNLVKTIEAGPAYRVRSVITVATTGIARDVFLFDTASGNFARTCRVDDITNYPVGRPAADAASAPYYRADMVTMQFSEPLPANAFVDLLREQLQLLAREYDAGVNSFVANVTESFVSP